MELSSLRARFEGGSAISSVVLSRCVGNAESYGWEHDRIEGGWSSRGSRVEKDKKERAQIFIKISTLLI